MRAAGTRILGNREMNFVHLNCHSYYSLLSGTNSVKELMEEAKRLGMKALALTDTNGMYGAVEFYRAAKEAGIKPIIGADIRYGEERALLLALDREGFGAISRILTDMHMVDGFLLQDALRELGKSRVAAKVAVLVDSPAMLGRLEKDAVLPRLYAEVIRDGRSSSSEVKLVRTAKRMGVPLVATNNVHFIRPEDHHVHRVLRAIAGRTTLSALERREVVSPECSFKSGSEMVCLFHDLMGAVANASRLAEECNIKFDLGKPVFPEFDIPKGETHYSYLCKICFDGAARLYKPLTRTVIKRLSYELEVIDKLGFSPYFLIVWDIVRFANENDIPVVGRGSAADSLISYVLSITPVDPIKHNLYFERFLNLERDDQPDIDVDFC